MMIRACLCLAGLLMAPAMAAQTLPQEPLQQEPWPPSAAARAMPHDAAEPAAAQADKADQAPAPAIDTPAAVAHGATPDRPVRRRTLAVRKQPEARSGLVRPGTGESLCSGYPMLR